MAFLSQSIETGPFRTVDRYLTRDPVTLQTRSLIGIYKTTKIVRAL